MNIAKLSKALIRAAATVGLVAGLVLPASVLAVEKPTVEPRSQEVRSTNSKLKEAAGIEQAAVNINTADAATLAASLNGIGIKKAEAIVAYRDQNGKFTSADQLLEVKGIGKATLDKNRDKIKI